MLHLMKLKGCVPLLNILWGYLIVTFALGEKKCERNANRGRGLCYCKRSHITAERGVMSVQTFTQLFAKHLVPSP